MNVSMVLAMPSGCVPCSISRSRFGNAVSRYGSVLCPWMPVPSISADRAFGSAQDSAISAVVAGVRDAPTRWQSMKANGIPVVSSYKLMVV